MDKATVAINTESMSYIAAIDIGSNAIRLAIAHKTSEGLHVSYRSRKAVRLGSSVFSKGKIDKKTTEDLKKALLQFRNQLENYNVQTFRAIATSAMREAQNSDEVVEYLAKETGIRVEVISGDEEARLVFDAISEKVDLSKGHQLLIDIGGGSIELVAIVDGQILAKESFVIGMVRILELHKEKSKKIEKWLPEYIKKVVQDFFSDLPPLNVAVGTGGNMDRFLKMKPFVSKRDGIDLNRHEMLELYKKLSSVSYEERISKFSLKPDRADVIVPAAIATNTFMEIAHTGKILFPEVGIKDGILYELAAQL